MPSRIEHDATSTSFFTGDSIIHGIPNWVLIAGSAGAIVLYLTYSKKAKSSAASSTASAQGAAANSGSNGTLQPPNIFMLPNTPAPYQTNNSYKSTGSVQVQAQNLKSNTPNGGTFDLSWQPVPGATKYVVKDQATGNSWTYTGDVNSTHEWGLPAGQNIYTVTAMRDNSAIGTGQVTVNA